MIAFSIAATFGNARDGSASGDLGEEPLPGGSHPKPRPPG